MKIGALLLLAVLMLAVWSVGVSAANSTTLLGEGASGADPWSLEPARVMLAPFVEGLDSPVDIAHAGDERLFVVEQAGRIRVVQPDGTLLTIPFLDIAERAASVDVGAFTEGGLLGLAFHPNYRDNGYFYVNYTFFDQNYTFSTRISRFQVSDDPDVADAGSERVLLSFEQPHWMHNGGDLLFGPDGYLYILTGDGGPLRDPDNRGQDGSTLLGKVLRIDVDEASPYAIPPDNPFVGEDGMRDEIWALGLRNPWRGSFDRLTGDLYLADVGQDAWEEVNFQPADSAGGENYGWRCYEGNHPFDLEGCGAASSYTFPVYEYSHDMGESVTGGYVYRGERYPVLVGYYLFADFTSGGLWVLPTGEESGWQAILVERFANQAFSTFGEDSEGELYLAELYSGTIYQIQIDTLPPTPTATSTGTSTATATPSSTFTATPTATFTATPKPTNTPTATPTEEPVRHLYLPVVLRK
ncbi:MAG: PQQ-dependent sugar dehydrogenase [Chloroflexota bacterium]|nr:PQQ-dependent sugar dehydrogenase [Chloroflexota bacterium]